MEIFNAIELNFLTAKFLSLMEHIYIDGYVFPMGRSRGVCSIYNLARNGSIEERDIRVAYFFFRTNREQIRLDFS